MLDIHKFRRWALGDLVGNLNRAMFAEWMVAQALGAIGPEEARQEWTAFDFLYKKLLVEVRATGRSQTWSRAKRSGPPRFNISLNKSAWDADTDEWVDFEPPIRPADVYVFCLHEAVPATNENVLDPRCWRFWCFGN